MLKLFPVKIVSLSRSLSCLVKHTIVRLPQITSEGSETECYINANFINVKNYSLELRINLQIELQT